jgi:hypothetical protein
MKLVSRVSMAFKKDNAVDKVKFGSGVLACLSQPSVAASFPNLPVPVANLQDINDVLNEAVVAVQTTGSRQSKTALKNAVTDWTSAFGITGTYIGMVAQGNDQLINEAGYLATKSVSQPKQKPGLATDFQATINGFKGAILAGTQTPVAEAAAYVVYAFPDGVSVNFTENTMIITVEGKSIYINTVTQKKTEMYNLPSSAAFNVGMYAINSAGVGPATATQKVVTQ